MKLVRLVVAGAALALVASPVWGRAGGAGGVAAPPLAAGSAVVGACDSAVGVTYQGAPGPVTAVVVDGLAPGCTGARLALTVVDGAGAAVGSGSVSSVSGSTATVPLSAAVDPASAKGVRLVLVGP